MKRIILGLSLLLLLVQNGFAKTDAEYDKQITNESDKVWKQIYRCNKEAKNHKFDGDVNVCLKAIDMVDKNRYVLKEGLEEGIPYLSTGVLYYDSEKNYIKAYDYFKKAAKFGQIKAQSNLDVLCREHLWVCK